MNRVLIICLFLVACSNDHSTTASTQEEARQVCLAFQALDNTQIETSDPDEVFNLVADKIQPQLEPESNMWMVLRNLRLADTAKRYEMYVFTGDDLGEDWRCESMEKQLTP